MYDRFSGIKFWSSERNTENMMSINEEKYWKYDVN